MNARLTFSLLVFCPVTSLLFADESDQSRIHWLKQQAIPFDTPEAGNGYEDLQPLKTVIGDARVVALGESTHGSREIFQMKHRLVEFLASELGFTIFSIEANMPESYRLNDYVLGGGGDPAKLIAGMYFWTWNTEEVLDMVQWMRQFNDRDSGRIQFTGFDMQTPDVAMSIVLDFLAEADEDLHARAKSAYAQSAKARRSSAGGFGVATGTFPVEAARGKRVTFSGWIKTDKVAAYAGLWWRVDGPDQKRLAFDNMASQKVRGTKDWAQYKIELDVPVEATNINFGVLMPGQGTAWFDDLVVKLDGEKFEDPEQFDLDFESDQPKGLGLFRLPSYRVQIDKGTAKTGEQSLRIESVQRAEGDEQGPNALEASRQCSEVVRSMERMRERYTKETESEKVEWAIQNARVVTQCMQARAGAYGAARDQSMAGNVAWILRQNPDAKIVLWAHNGHIAKRPKAMGQHLAEAFGDQYLPIAFATYRGEYQAVGRGGLGDHPLAKPPVGSVEDHFQRTGMPRFALDLRKAQGDSPESGWLTRPARFRSIGALAMENQFSQQNLAEAFDAVIYIEETTAARPIRN